MEAIPPAGWADVATKHDLDARFAVAKAELETVKAELRTEIQGVRTELQGFRGDVYDRLGDLQRNLVLGMVAAQATFGALVIAAVRAMTG